MKQEKASRTNKNRPQVPGGMMGLVARSGDGKTDQVGDA
jgi:hypothetical protein